MYFDYKLIKTFRYKSVSFKKVRADIIANNFKNINVCEEVYDDLAALLCDDYNLRFANYRGYMEKGMDLRIFAELRKSAIMNTECIDFFKLHEKCKTIQDIKNARIIYLNPYTYQFFRDGYRDEDWQLFYILLATTHDKESRYSISIDFDAMGLLVDTPEDYRPKVYIQEALRIYTDYDPLGRPRKEPIDITDWLYTNGYI